MHYVSVQSFLTESGVRTVNHGLGALLRRRGLITFFHLGHYGRTNLELFFEPWCSHRVGEEHLDFDPVEEQFVPEAVSETCRIIEIISGSVSGRNGGAVRRGEGRCTSECIFSRRIRRVAHKAHERQGRTSKDDSPLNALLDHLLCRSLN